MVTRRSAAERPRVIFFGTPAFAVPTLRRLRESGADVVAVVTQPDRPRGRGRPILESPVKALARAAGVPVLQPVRLRDAAFVAALAGLEADVGVVAAYGKILPREVLDLPPHGLLNVHASLLPKYRGASPVHRAVMAGETETGVTIMKVVAELDAGPMLASASRPIGPDETSDAVERDLAGIGAELLVRTLTSWLRGEIAGQPQNEAEATYAPRLTKEEGLVDWRRPAEDIHNQVRGLHPWPHAFTYLEARRYILLETRTEPQPEAASGEPVVAAGPIRQTQAGDAGARRVGPGVPPGTVLEAEGDRLVVATGAGVLRILGIQPENRRAMTSREFLAGRSLAPGARFESVEAA